MAAANWQYELDVARGAVLRAAKLTKKMLATVSEVSKADSSPVTVADFAAQALIISILHELFPDDSFVGEEDAGVLRREAGLRERVYEIFSAAREEVTTTAQDEAQRYTVDQMLDFIDMGGCGQGGAHGRFWVMDPVDGTATFLRGEQYAVSLALIEDGKEVLGVIACPNLKLDDTGRIRESSVDKVGLGIILSAVKGQGATVTALPSAQARTLPEPVPLEPLQPPAEVARAHIVDCSLNPTASRAKMQEVANRLGASFPGTDVWSSHIRYAALVVGGGDILIRIPSAPGSTTCIWDHAGAQLIFKELGGKVTDLDGRPVDFSAGRHLSNNRGLLSARKDIHAKVLAVVQELLSVN
ncbi:3'(2'),5'-bisphosphate nucleotidase [Purpureocillium takamizusanense]|uniref:3'(2'),5'-bisphosphate nucleotidase n=1 Tax=Purpureocillium takamizusanense TaxID=2060973 RepID=A0A9Q8Q8X8_9HYPO|nr:3'(2'),5'-bisphosphate nucleotidase [Purpureocillium takamizusanense]UNI14557.1 3'(2'),5'-bisphosphate nucleotidase [Purpureocillium takamizusanense]